ncbi:MAG: tape measure protein [Rhodospirillaceae bacterium]
MATNDQILAVTVEARINRLEKEMKKASGIVGNNFNQMERRTKQAADRMERTLLSSTANINRMLGGIGVGNGFNELRQLAERWTDLTSRGDIAAGSQTQGAEVMERISQIARRTYSDLGQTAEVYIANSTALRELGYSTQTQLDYTEALNNALVVSGAKGDRAASVMNALSKAMALGELRGEELNTVIQSGGRVAQALAEGLGVTTNELRKLGTEGKLTGDVVLKALTSQHEKLREDADSMPATISDAVVLLRNAMTEYVGKVNEARGITSIFSDGIILAADNVEHIANAAAAAGLAILSGYVPGLARATVAQVAMVATNPFLLLVSAIGAATFALSAFGDEIHPVQAEMATLQDYAGAAWDEIAGAAVSAGSAISEAFLNAINWIVRALDGAEVSFDDLANFAKETANTLIGAFGLIYDGIVITFTKLPDAVADAVLSGMNALIAGVEHGINAVIEAVNAAIEGLNSIGNKVGVTLGTVAPVTLQRIENAYAGAGAAAGAAYGEALRKSAQDHIGNALGSLRTSANERAAAREAAPEADAPSGDTSKRAATPGTIAADYGKAENEAKKLKDTIEKTTDATQDFRDMGKDTLRGFIGDLRAGADGVTILSNLLNRLADQLMEMALSGMFSGSSGSSMGTMMGAIGALFGFSRGGYTGDRGTAEVAGVVHGKEFVVNAKATEKHRPLLEAINRGVPGYSNGGFVSATPSAHATGAPIGGFAQSNIININTPVTVNAKGGTPEQNEDLARRVAKQLEASQRALVVSEVQKQMRPGNMLNTRAK